VVVAGGRIPSVGFAQAETKGAVAHAENTAGGLQMKITFKQILIYLIIAFVILFIWNDPTGAGNAIGNFFTDVGSFIGDLFNKFASFVSSWSNS
jgi:hypothetical protein